MRPGRVLVFAAALYLVAALAASEAGQAAGKVADLGRALLTDPSYKVRTQAALLLGKLGDPDGVDALVEAMSDDNKTVRAMAAQSLGKLGGEKAVAALKRISAQERDAFVREQVEKALAILLARRVEEGGKDRKLYLKLGPFTGGSKAADSSLLGLLRGSLRKALEELPQVVVAEGAEERNMGRSGRPAFLVDGNVTKLEEAGSAGETSCEVKVMVARWPSRSVILWTSAGAAVQGGSRDRQRARRSCIEASAGQLGDSLLGYFKSQGG